MSSGTKVALVALMVLVMVVIAKLVNDESDANVAGGGGLGGETGTGVLNTGEKNVGGADARKAGLAVQNPKVNSRANQKAARKPDLQISANPSSRPKRTVGARSLDSTRIGPIVGSTDGGRPGARSDPRTARRPPESAGGPIFGDSTDQGRTGVRGARRSPAIPVSVKESGSSERAGEHNALVETQLGVEPATGTDRVSTSSTRTQLAQGATRRSTAGKVQLKSYNLSKPSEVRRSNVGSSTAGFPLTYTIRPNDNLWNLAAKYYGGRGYLFKHIVRRNPGVKIHPGKTLIIPAPPPAEPSKTATTTDTRRFENTPTRGSATGRTTPPPKTHTIQKGETLWEIAGRVYGDPTQYVRIERANPQLKNPNKVKAGTKIVIP